MAIGYLNQNGKPAYGIADIVLDDDKDIESLPHNLPMGSTAFVIESQKILMSKSDGTWKELS